MKHKKDFIVFIFASICLSCFILLSGCNKSSKSPSFSDGNFKDNNSDFSEQISFNTESPVVDSYYKNVSYTVEFIDTDKNTIMLNVSTPDFSTILDEIIDESINNNADSDYETVLEETRLKLQEALESPQHPVITKQIELEICKDDEGTWKIVPNDEFYGIITESVFNVLEEW